MAGKWGKYLKRYNSKWETEEGLKHWIAPSSQYGVSNGDLKAYCKLCKVHIRAHHSDLVAHSKREKHKAKELQLFESNQNSINNDEIDYESTVFERVLQDDIIDEVSVDEVHVDEVTMELFSGDEPLLKRSKPDNSCLKNSSTKVSFEESEKISHSCHPCGDETKFTKCKWQELAQEKILAVQEKRAQQRKQHNMIKAEFELKMEIMREESELRKRKLELEIINLEKGLDFEYVN